MLRNFLIRFLIIISIPDLLIGSTNNITYFDLTSKELAINQLEDLYYLKLSKSTRLTGQSIIDFNNFNCISRVRTYTTIKIEF
jgi:hypothetical protein